MLHRNDCIPMLVAAAVLMISACGDSSPTANDNVNRDIATLRAATTRYQDFNAAIADGYDNKLTDCMVMPPLGGMGVHWAKTGLIDGSVDVAKPEVLLYEPQPDGSKKFVAVEYIIPYTILPRSATPPVLFGKPFKQNDTFQLWGLHAWVWQANPTGLFADWNPTVNCNSAPPAARVF